jgi:hypothetical protein
MLDWKKSATTRGRSAYFPFSTAKLSISRRSAAKTCPLATILIYQKNLSKPGVCL